MSYIVSANKRGVKGSGLSGSHRLDGGARPSPVPRAAGHPTSRRCQASAEVSVNDATWSITTRSAAASPGACS
ncbi:hypothetical protein GCM10027294_01800 [Marinactinospora endophytica]